MSDRPRGRPPLDPAGNPSVPVHLKLVANDYDRVDRIARERRESVQDVIRRGIQRILTDERGGTI